MRVTLVEVLVVIAIIATLCGLLAPVVLSSEQGEASAPPVSLRMYTVQHDKHWWVVRGEVFLHHPDCPCGSRTAEKSP